MDALKGNLFTYLFFGIVFFTLFEFVRHCTLVFLLALTQLNKDYC